LQEINNSLPLPSRKRGNESELKEKNIFFSKYLPDNKKGVLLHPLIERLIREISKESS
jgi:hypothetical protein